MRFERFILAAGIALAPVAAYADAASEIVTAQTHAGLASQASDLMGVHMHLHHTVNCLVGPGGTGFDSKELNPCANAGKGAIPDTTDAAEKKLLNDAVTKAEAGIAAMSFPAARDDAAATAAMLKAK